jgi:hypothetical protein
MRIVSELGIGLAGRKSGRTPFVSGFQSARQSNGFEYAAARHADVHVLRIARIDQDRMHLRAVGRAVLIAAAPGLALRMVVEAVDAGPRQRRRPPIGTGPAAMCRRTSTPGCVGWPGVSQNV